MIVNKQAWILFDMISKQPIGLRKRTWGHPPRPFLTDNPKEVEMFDDKSEAHSFMDEMSRTRDLSHLDLRAVESTMALMFIQPEE